MSDLAGRAAVVGGSIAGCAAAIALRHAGLDVEVYERSRGALRDRGAGIAIPTTVWAELVTTGYIAERTPVRPTREAVWMARGRLPVGRELGRQPLLGNYVSWATLWHALREHVPDEAYHAGVAVDRIDADPHGVTVITADGGSAGFDAVVGADGYRSRVRTLIDPQAGPVYAGYVAWRGDYPARLMPGPPPPVLDHAGTIVGFPGGHAVFYLIPDTGEERINWVLYHRPPSELAGDRPVSIPKGRVSEELGASLHGLAGEHLPGYWAEVVHRTDRSALSVQPVFDTAVRAYASGRVALIGDAGALARPHTGAGATKALQDALALERLSREHGTWEALLAAYDRERRAAGNALVELGRHFGRTRVLDTPPWEAMTPADFAAWFAENARTRPVPYDRRWM